MIAPLVRSTLRPGTRIGPYEVEAVLGSGGMGEVYRARDGRLGRAVALKLLPAGVATDETALLRFEQEARAASALSHPNVVAVFDVGQQDGRPWLAMELVEGISLRGLLLQRGAPPVRQALDLACQLADGLAAAHARGIVHRDLKPENLMVGDDDRLKILDFGIAKLAAPSHDSDTTVFGQHGVLPVHPDPHTQPGTILGTVGYLSPEQARGQAADARSDQFAFGAILYELLAGERAFRGETTVDTLSAILREDPPPLPSERAARVPAPVLWVVQRCLAKEPRDRYASTLDLARDLRQLRDNLASLSTLSSGSPVASAEAPRRQRKRPSRTSVMWGAAGLAALAAAFAGGVLLAPRIGPVPARGVAANEAGAVPALRYVSYSGRDGAPALSRDGRLLAFVSRRTGAPRIWVQVVGSREAALTDGPDEAPRISPDGTAILFVRDEGTRRSLYRVPVVGGPPRKVIDDAAEGDWSPDGRRIVFVRIAAEGGRTRSLLGTAAADGGEPRELTRVEDRVLRSPRWSPDGSRIAARVGPLQGQMDPELALFDAKSGARRKLPVSQRQGQVYGLSWRSPGELVYAEVSGATAAGSSRVLALDVASGDARTVFTLPGRVALVDAAGARIAADVLSNRQTLRELPLAGRASAAARPPAHPRRCRGPPARLLARRAIAGVLLQPHRQPRPLAARHDERRGAPAHRRHRRRLGPRLHSRRPLAPVEHQPRRSLRDLADGGGWQRRAAADERRRRRREPDDDAGRTVGRLQLVQPEEERRVEGARRRQRRRAVGRRSHHVAGGVAGRAARALRYRLRGAEERSAARRAGRRWRDGVRDIVSLCAAQRWAAALAAGQPRVRVRGARRGRRLGHLRAAVRARPRHRCAATAARRLRG